MKAIKAFGLLASLGGLLIALNLGGTAGCGDSNGGGGGGGGTTTEENAAAFSAISGLSSFAADNDAALQVTALALKAQTTDEICTEGTVEFTPSGITFNDCVDEFGNTIDGTIGIDGDTDGEEPFISTISFDNVHFDDVDCGNFILDGDAVVSVFLDGSGTIDYGLTISGPGGDVAIDCTISLDYTCPDFVTECGGGGFTESELCLGDEFRDDITCE